MKRLNKIRKGVASLMIVIISTLLFGIITLGFLRLVATETGRIINDDLAQSAYDAALAGIEDAKIALAIYHQCLDSGVANVATGVRNYTYGTTNCEEVIRQVQNAGDGGWSAASVLGRSRETYDCSVDDPSSCSSSGYAFGGETVIQEVQSSDRNGNTVAIQQAYTQAIVREAANDYRTTLDDENRVRMVPIRSANVSKINSMRVSWYSRTNRIANGDNRAPLISVQFLQRMSNSMAGFDVVYTPRETAVTNTGFVYLRPIVGGSGTKEINAMEFGLGSTKANRNNTSLYPSQLVNVSCDPANGDFLCYADIDLPLAGFNKGDKDSNSWNDYDGWNKQRKNQGNFVCQNNPLQSPVLDPDTDPWACYFANGWDDDTMGTRPLNADGKPFSWEDLNTRETSGNFVIITLPFGTPPTDVSVEFHSRWCAKVTDGFKNRVSYNGSNCSSDERNKDIVKLAGVQPVIDATGRANDMYRRLQARVELVDNNFPYPEYALQVAGNIEKRFYVTADENPADNLYCWSYNAGSNQRNTAGRSTTTPNGGRGCWSLGTVTARNP